MGHKFLSPHLGPQPLGRDFHGMNIRASKPLSRGKTSNVKHRTSNAAVSEDSRCHSMFGVGCSMLDVPLTTNFCCICNKRLHRTRLSLPIQCGQKTPLAAAVLSHEPPLRPPRRSRARPRFVLLVSRTRRSTRTIEFMVPTRG